MKHTKAMRSVLVSLILVSTGIGWGSLAAQANSREQDLIDWGRRQGYECRRQEEGIFCRDTDDLDRSRRRILRRPGEIDEGTIIETRATNREQIFLERNESLSLTLYVERDILDRNNRYVIIPRDSRIEGRLRPKDGGVRFEADDIILSNGRRYDLNAESDIIYPDRRLDRGSSGGDTRITEAARVILSSVLGGSNGRLGDIFSQSDRDVFGSSRTRARRNVVIVEPDRDLDLQLTSDLRIR